MNKELLEESVEVHSTPEANAYEKYIALGGIINESDYNSALSRLETLDEVKSSPGGMAEFAGIKLDKDGDRRVKLYSILRNDVRSEGNKHHHDQMSDQQIFVEALRMLGDADSVEKMIVTYPNISFAYSRD